jgi:hypothetical protein
MFAAFYSLCHFHLTYEQDQQLARSQHPVSNLDNPESRTFVFSVVELREKPRPARVWI